MKDSGPRPFAPCEPPGVTDEEAELLRTVFVEEAHDHLDAMRGALGALERAGDGAAPPSAAVLAELLRKTHTLKGSAAMAGMHAAADAAHTLENAVARLREVGCPIAPSVARLLRAIEVLRSIVDATPGASGAPLVAQLAAELAEVQVQEDADAPGASVSLHPLPRSDAHLLRVDAARVDELLDTAGDLVFDRTRIERRVHELQGTVKRLASLRASLRALAAGTHGEAALQPPLGELAAVDAELGTQLGALVRGGAALLEDTEALRRTTAALAAGLARMRTLPLRALFSHLGRLADGLARATGRRLEIVTSGEDTELDRAVVDQLADPLVQIVRNALAHGIEPPFRRTALGKAAVGRITMSARHQGDAVFVEVADDGAGIDVNKVRAALVASGRLSPEEAIAWDDARVMQAIFQPGVSSRGTADELAGRGVGLDLVKDAIVRLGGDIDVASVPGRATRFLLRLPLTTVSMKALVFEIGGHAYALPSARVSATYASGQAPSVLPPGTAPLDLRRLLDAREPGPASEAQVLVEHGDLGALFACDRIVGTREVVIRSLGPLLAPLRLYAGATVSGAGVVQLILDPAALVRAARPNDGPPPDRTAAAATGRAAQRPRVLVVDDSATVRESVSRALTAAGYAVETAADGEQAWELLGYASVDLVVTDLEMPRLSGTDLVARIRAAGPRPPILVLSSMNAQAALHAGADASLAKPVASAHLLDRVAELLAKR